VINYRLASAINPPASPSTNLRFHRSSDLRLCSNWLPTCVGGQPCCGASDQLPISPEIASFGLSFSSASDLRRLLLLRSSLRTNFQSFVGHLIFQLTFQSTSDSRRILHRPVCLRTRLLAFARCRAFQLSSRIDLQLASDIEPSSSAFQSTSDSSSDIASLTAPSDQLPTCVGAPSSSFALRFNFQLALAASSSRFPFHSTSDLRRLLSVRFCQRSTFDFFRSLSPPAVPSTNCQLALTIHLSAVPANQLSDFHLEYDPPVCFPN